MFFAGTNTGELYFIDIENRKVDAKVSIHDRAIVEIVQDDTRIVTGSQDGKVRVWDIKKLQRNPQGVLQPFYDIKVPSPVRSLKYLDNNVRSRN